jgi:hypothetical protein
MGATAATGGSITGDGEWGHADIAGSMYEWLLDFQDPCPLPCRYFNQSARCAREP